MAINWLSNDLRSLQLRRETWKIQDFNRFCIRDLTVQVRHPDQRSYEAIDGGR